MAEILKIVFSSVWTFSGSALLLLITAGGLTQFRPFAVTIVREQHNDNRTMNYPRN